VTSVTEIHGNNEMRVSPIMLDTTINVSNFLARVANWIFIEICSHKRGIEIVSVPQVLSFSAAP